MQHAATAAAAAATAAAFRLLNLQKTQQGKRRCQAAQADAQLEELTVNYICYTHTHAHTGKLLNVTYVITPRKVYVVVITAGSFCFLVT